MRQKWLATVTLAAPLILTGCMRQVASTSATQYLTSVPVRFVQAPQPEWTPTMDAEGNVSVAADTMDMDADGTMIGDTPEMEGDMPVTGDTMDTEAELSITADTPEPGYDTRAFPVGAPESNVMHVALWGGPFDGNDVTYGVTLMTPGSYTFAFLDRTKESSMQGWVDVNGTGSDILDVLYRWKNNIPQYKERIAYEWEILGGTEGPDAPAFVGFESQLKALDSLERRINSIIRDELRAQRFSQQNMADFMRHTELLVIPGEEEFFTPTTRPTFTEDDVTTILAGTPMTKIVLIADHDDARWKLERVNDLYGDLVRCKEVFREEVDRLERRKGLFLLTDHLHHHDTRFVENEIQLQQALDSLATLEADMSVLRDRRTALAFITGLFSPDGTFRALDHERANLKREYAVLEVEKRRIDTLLDEVDESSVRRVALERRRQRIMAGIESINQQLEALGEARNALVTMSESTDVLHRQGDTRLLTSTFIAADMPFTVRQAVENESLMTVRLEANDSVFVPTTSSVTFNSSAPPTMLASQTPEGHTVYTPTPAAPEYSGTRARRASRWFVPDADHPTGDVDSTTGMPYATGHRGAHHSGEECPPIIKLLVPPCWFND